MTSSSSKGSLERDAEIEGYPFLTYHYGLSFEELVRMPRWAIRMYVRSLPGILAEQQLGAFQATIFPDLKPAVQRSMQRRLLRAVRGQGDGERLPRERFDGAMAGIGIKVVRT